MRVKRHVLQKSVFIRLLFITFAAVLLFYILGMIINRSGIDSVRQEINRLGESNTKYIASQLVRDIENLSFFCT